MLEYAINSVYERKKKFKDLEEQKEKDLKKKEPVLTKITNMFKDGNYIAILIIFFMSFLLFHSVFNQNK